MSDILFDQSKDMEKKPEPDVVKNSIPTPEEMRAVSVRHSKEEWNKLCTSSNFMEALTTDIPKAKWLAEKILAGRGDTYTKK